MAISFIELLKDVENANRTGFKEGKGWLPHKSAEGGTRTLAFGHKLSPQEEKGNYVELPNGDIVEFSDRGLTEEEAESLLHADVAKAKKIAERQWDKSQKTSFKQLPALHQNLLSEIVFNIGTLNNSKGDFGWPSLAKGIENKDTDVIKAELMRSFTDPDGNKKQLTRRVNKIRDYVDSPDLDADILTPDAPTEQAPDIDPMGFLDNFTLLIQERLKGASQPSQEPTEAITEPEVPTTSFAEQIEEGVLSKREAAEKFLKRTANEAKLEAEAGGRKEPPKGFAETLRSSPKAREVLKEKFYNRPTYTAEVKEEVSEGVQDATKDPTYGIF